MARPKIRGYDRDGRLAAQTDQDIRFFGKIKGKWAAVWAHLVFTPPPTKRTKIDWRE
jgi:hypothetical protein